MPDTPRWRRPTAVPCAIAVLGAVLSGCGGSSGPVTLTVLGASSLTDVMDELGATYQQRLPQVRIRTVYGGSQEMAAKVGDHEPADVLVTADETSMKEAARYLAGRSRIVAHNSLAIAVRPGNPKRLRTPADLARPGLKVVTGGPIVPVGRYAQQLFARAGVTVRTSSQEISARAVLDRVRAREADAGVVYVTDLRSAGVAVGSVPIPTAENVTASYPAAALRGGHVKQAEAFVSWLTSPAARSLFGKYGFAAPAAGG
ncbi:molybdate ABC transporter substrate-binding protein [Actinomadura rupiterrae]|uniref:molybdate ABC transporter substrate-binding protein n=1 Tax=Actinomadura rupiterrae TaxID=559627 RepID=UPI0020A46E18|nr:molybdate ABC transporter substrate-binding protein [Actinomadura rupiterrae]MCP2343865.1 molybdate transport system substrate-binding protein [Actinomadura rupiterrae]